ncbi:alpha-(1,3)-fucosyltransferase 7-like [Salvelinus alpinus]|uniref:alpha-(1,3)-fucosyltransferase 7-like n=1 Tax=Salvelinus alpinus TaxID=8036 RepID=UPI0039FCEE3F
MTTSMPLFLSAIMLLSISSYVLHQRLLLLAQIGIAHQHQPRNLTILLWHWPFGHPYSLEGDVCSDKYGILGCLLSDNTSLFPQADVVVFHHHELRTGRSSLPLHLPRPVSQRWLWLSLEPPVHNGNLTQYNGLFNWTMSYRGDADISMPYGKIVMVPHNGNSNSSSFVIPKKGACLASWVVSNYRPDHARSQVYQSLRKYIPIEVYGHWSKRPLTDQSLIPIIGHCNFYLAFENSVALDYITEKLWRNAYQAGAVPVVLGTSRANYEALVPPGSFIHVSDFNSTEGLAVFLQQLATDRGRYEGYFKWRQTYRIKMYTDWRERLCNICANYQRLPGNKVYYDLEAWASR